MAYNDIIFADNMTGPFLILALALHALVDFMRLRRWLARRHRESPAVQAERIAEAIAKTVASLTLSLIIGKLWLMVQTGQ